jgi:hypothetical protein
MRERRSFPDVAVKMIEVGESTGALQEMLNSLADFYDEEIETEVSRFITLVDTSAPRHHGRHHRGGRPGSNTCRCFSFEFLSWARRSGVKRLCLIRTKTHSALCNPPTSTPRNRSCASTGGEVSAGIRLHGTNSETTRSCSGRFPGTLMLAMGSCAGCAVKARPVIVVSDPWRSCR